MTLKRRYLRNIRENLSFYISSTILTMVTLLLFFMFTIAGNGILNFSAEFFPAHKLEDANFTTYVPIPDEKLTELEEEYDLTLEAERYADIETDGTTARVFKKTEKVDLYEVTVGEDNKRNDEILISEGYAVNMDVAIGDKLTIGEKEYTVTGFFQRPDYLYMLEHEDDSYKNITTFFLCYMTDEAFDELEEFNCRYLVRYEKDNSADFRKVVNGDYYMHSYLSAEENPRITMVDTQAEMFVAMAYLILVILPLIAVALVSIIISRKVKSEQRMIGTLSALGYRKRQLMWHYAGFAALPGLVGGVLTAISAVVFAQPYSELGLQDYEPMRITGHLEPLNGVLGIVIPTLMYVIAALLAVRKLLQKDTGLLLSGNADGEENRRKKILRGKNISFKKKFALRSLLGNPARGFVVLLGVFLGCFIVLFSFSMFDSMEGVVEEMSETVGSYENQYVLNTLSEQNSYGGAELLVSVLEDENGNSINLIGTDEDNPYLYFRDLEGKDVSIGDGYYISSLAALVLGWQEGDRIDLYNPLSLEKTRVTISGVLDNDMSKAVYTSRENAAKLTGLEPGVYNALISDRELDIPESEVREESHKSDIREQVDTIVRQMGAMLYLLMGLGIVICIAAIYVAVNMMVTENRSNISMLKVLGYKDREINRIVLSVNHIFLPLGILLSIPAALGVMNGFFTMFADMFNMLIKAAITPKSYVISIALTVVSYMVSLVLVRRKVKRVDMLESL